MEGQKHKFEGQGQQMMRSAKTSSSARKPMSDEKEKGLLDTRKVFEV